jgi:hypothetical protein
MVIRIRYAIWKMRKRRWQHARIAAVELLTMSALGHKRTSAGRARMSALPPRADIHSIVSDVR